METIKDAVLPRHSGIYVHHYTRHENETVVNGAKSFLPTSARTLCCGRGYRESGAIGASQLGSLSRWG